MLLAFSLTKKFENDTGGRGWEWNCGTGVQTKVLAGGG